MKKMMIACVLSAFASMSVYAVSNEHVVTEAPIETKVETDSSGFPLRERYYKVKTISTDDLYAKFSDYILIDVRSPFEHAVMRIDGAFSVPVADKQFIKKVAKIWNENNKKPIVFYCYGHKCERSYQASMNMMQSSLGGGMQIMTYDGGITDWSDIKPDKTVLFDKSFDKSKIISSKEFKKHLAKPLDFTSQVNANPSIVVIDIRDGYETNSVSLFPGRDYRTGFDFEKLKSIIIANRDAKKTVYFYDEAGYRVKSLQYLIKEIGLEDYMFLEDGMVGYFKSIK